MSFYPSIGTPTGGRRLGAGKVTAFLPLWAQKDAGAWSLFSGGGYAINPGAGQRNFWLAGLGITRAVGGGIRLGAEIYRQSADERDAPGYTRLGFGATMALSDRWTLLASAGPGLAHARETGWVTGYVGLLFTP